MPDTIAAVATGSGLSAIGIIRISGPEAIESVSKLFSPMPDEDRKLAYGELRTTEGGLLDLCLCMVAHAPDTVTGEDYAEIQCHGSPVNIRTILGELFSLGVRQAGPGEFSKRAFINGKLTLSGAEAIVDLVEAETEEAAKNASAQLGGAISRCTDGIYDGIVDICSHYHAVLDYPDEDIEPFEMADYEKSLQEYCSVLEKLLKTAGSGMMLKEGIPTAIVGLPNAGKSSLLNALLGYERAIVTSVPGTTRDTVEEKVKIGHAVLRLIDTAGIRESDDEVERLGVERSRKAMESARLVINVIDGTTGEGPLDDSYLAVYNKCDLPGFRGGEINISAKTGEGIDTLREKIEEMFPLPDVPAGEILTNVRQVEAVRISLDYLKAALEAMRLGATPDIVLTECEGALNAIGELDGRTIREDVTNRIFARFCVGK